MIATYSRSLIEMLLNVHALANMYRATNDDEYRKSAAAWIPALESQLASLREELNKKAES